jgi:ABC-type uncharacterized transport system auxiliary subunit
MTSLLRLLPLAALALPLAACSPRDEPATTPLPTRQTTIDPAQSKLDAAQKDAEKRRADADRAGQ